MKDQTVGTVVRLMFYSILTTIMIIGFTFYMVFGE